MLIMRWRRGEAQRRKVRQFAPQLPCSKYLQNIYKIFTKYLHGITYHFDVDHDMEKRSSAEKEGETVCSPAALLKIFTKYLQNIYKLFTKYLQNIYKIFTWNNTQKEGETCCLPAALLKTRTSPQLSNVLFCTAP